MTQIFPAIMPLLAVFASHLAVDEGAQPGIRVERAIVVADPAPMKDSAIAGYARLRSEKRDDRLLGGSCTCAGVFQIHRIVRDPKPDMVVDPHLLLPRGATIDVRPGSDYHLWLAEIHHPVPAGSNISISLQFEKAGMVSVDFLAVANSRDACAAMDNEQQ